MENQYIHTNTTKMGESISDEKVLNRATFCRIKKKEKPNLLGTVNQKTS